MTRTPEEKAASAVYSANVRAEMARRGVRHAALAEAIGISVDALRRRLGGRAVWSANELQRAARHLDVTLDVLTQGSERAGS